MNVLSLFDGMSCGQIALNRANIPYDKYYASEIDKHAILVTQSNYSNTIQLGDVRFVKQENLPKIDLLIGGSPCFVGDTLVLTKNGYKNIKDIVIGDVVLSHTGNWRSVINIRNRLTQTRIISGYGNIGITTTDNHPFFTRIMKRVWNNDIKKRQRVFDNPEWTDAKNLTKSHYEAITSIPFLDTKYDYNFWYMIGRYTGDGWYRKTKRLHRKNSFMYQFIVCCGKHEFEYLKNKFDLFGYKYNYSKERTGYKFRICDMNLVSFVEKIGRGASNKVIHPALWSESRENILAFIDGYIESDGYRRKNSDKYRITTTSKLLAYGIQQLIVSALNVPVMMRYIQRPSKCVIEGRIVNQKNCYEIEYKTNVGKQDKAFFDDIYAWMPVKTNVCTNNLELVYNLEVEIDNSYTANNVVVHNCTGFSSSGKKLNFNDPQSILFFEYIRLLNECNPKYFLLENVVMKKEHEDVISSYMGVRPVMIDSAMFSAQSRKRLYWTNINFDLPATMSNLVVSDIMDDNVDSKYLLSNSYNLKNNSGEYRLIKLYMNYRNNSYINHNKPTLMSEIKDETPSGRSRQTDRLYSSNSKSPTLLANRACDIKFDCGTSNYKKWRNLTPIEAERLQTVPDNYASMVSEQQRYKMLGNGWTVDVIAHILKGLET